MDEGEYFDELDRLLAIWAETDQEDGVPKKETPQTGTPPGDGDRTISEELDALDELLQKFESSPRSTFMGASPQPSTSGYVGTGQNDRESPRPSTSGYNEASPQPSTSGYFGTGAGFGQSDRESPQPSTSGYNEASPQPSTSGYVNAGAEQKDPQSLQSEPEYTLTQREGLMNREFNVRETMFVIRLTGALNNQRWGQHLQTLATAFEDVLDRATEGLQGDDLLRVFINQEGLETPIILPLTPVSEVTVHVILALIEKILQSHDKLEFHKSFQIHVATVQLPRGGRGKRIVDLSTDLISKKSIVRINNADDICAARAIVVVKAKLDNHPRYKYIARSDRPLQGLMARELCDTAGVARGTPSSLSDISKFEGCLGVRIVVISAAKCNRVIYRGDQTLPVEPAVFIYHRDNHYDAIVNIRGFYGYAHYCIACLKPFNHLEHHDCGYICAMCFRVNCPDDNSRTCARCFRVCNNAQCFDVHTRERIGGKSLCEKFWRCVKCDKTMKRKRRLNHRCGEKFCFSCMFFYMEDSHDCFIQPRKPRKHKTVMIFFDFETVQSSDVHVVNLVVAHRVCKDCQDIDDIDIQCTRCGEREFVARGSDARDEFCRWLLSPLNQGAVCIAHNLKGFDGMFVLAYVVKNGVVPQVIYNGTKIMLIRIPGRNLTLIDSLCHIPIALSAFPKAFGLQDDVKGWFPHLFNVWDNLHYEGEIPDIRFYDPDNMFPSQREDFLKWHAEQRAKSFVFNFQREIYKYCRSDVDILRKSCLKYRRMIIGLTETSESDGIDPFNMITIASLCFAMYRHMFLKKNTIPKVVRGRLINDQYSKISICWLEWIMRSQRLHISHALNDKEKRIDRYRVDGWHDPSGTVFEFQGCAWHGCLRCFDPDTYSSVAASTMRELYEKTMRKKQYILDRGLKYISAWECDFRDEIKKDDELRDFVNNLDIQERLDPRDAFYGGRVNATKLFYEVRQEGDEIRYVDFTSLYPWVNKYCLYPSGLPQIITSDFGDITSYIGFAKVRVLPPRGLYLPLLPLRTKDKLMFPLCRTCCENEFNGKCFHDDDQRSWIATYVTLELHKAVKLGYVIEKIYEVYHFPKTCQRNEQEGGEGLFGGYMDMFLKIKQESSDWPEWVRTDADKKLYISSYKEREGIELDPSNIEKNPGLRTLSKLAMNSLWGKFGQRSNLKRSTFVSDVTEFYDLIFDKTKKVLDVHLITETMLLVDWVEVDLFEKTPASSCIFIAAFTTCSARLKLYSVLEKLGRRVLYFDTDSVIYVKKKDDDVDLPLGDYLGDLTNELGPGEFITIFVSGGSKNYAYVTNTGRTVCKVRGFTLNYGASGVINFHTVSEMVKNLFNHVCICSPTKTPCHKCCPRLTVTKQRKICRDRLSMTVYNRREDKDYRVCYTKRVVYPDFDTLPYGY